MNEFSDDFMRGQKDCQSGEPAKQNESDAYNRGYGAEYEKQAIQDWLDDRHS